MLNITLLNDLAELNNYYTVVSKNYIANYPLTLKFQISDNQSQDRLIPSTSATMNCIFQNSDGSELTVAASMLFNPDDRSMWQVSLDAAQSNNIVGSNFQVVLDFAGNASDIRVGMAINVLAQINFDGEC
jgi:hypothetical protein